MRAAILYGLNRGIRSSRKLEDACINRVDFIWLVEGREIDHSTFADFRTRFGSELKGLFRQVGRVAARISEDGRTGALVELNCETDFVARNDAFGTFVDILADHVMVADPGGDGALAGSSVAATGKTVAESLTDLTAVLGEKMEARRYSRLEAANGGVLGSYVHPGDRIAVIVELANAGDTDASDLQAVLRDVAMQICSMGPQFATARDVPEAWLAQEREIAMGQARELGKPENILERIADGKVKARLKEVCLNDQKFVRDTKGKQTVAEYVRESGKGAGAPDLAVSRFARFELGEGVQAADEDGD